MYRVLALAVAVLVANCAAPPPPPGDPRVQLTPDAGVSADSPRIVSGPLLRASIRLVNSSPADRPVLQTTDWTDVNKLPVRTLMSAPQRLTVPRFGDATIQVIAPNPKAVNFHTRIEPDFSATNPS
jgi:uncharacterized protein DUF1425